jgi:hypothetical protein
MASDALGTSDICQVIDPSDYSDTISDGFILKEDGEEIHFLLKSKEDEYAFTNYALVHADGDSATSSEVSLKRYEYHAHPISNVSLETAGTADRDVEITFGLGEGALSIDVEKDQLEKLIGLYKALVQLSLLMEDRRRKHEHRTASLDRASEVLVNSDSKKAEGKRSESLKEIHSYIHDWMSETHDEFWREDFGHVFEKYTP